MALENETQQLTLEERSIPASSRLLSIPAELRLNIYKFLLKADVERKTPRIEDVSFDFSVLGINKLLRQEAWHYFCTENQWAILYFHRAPGESCLDGDGHLRNQVRTLSMARFAQPMLLQLLTNFTIAFDIGYGCGTAENPPDKTNVCHMLVFPYSCQNWLATCLIFNTLPEAMRNYTIGFGPKYRDNIKLLDPKLLLGLASVLKAERVYFRNVQDDPLLFSVATAMCRQRTTGAEYQDKMVACHELGDYYRRHGLALRARGWYVGMDEEEEYFNAQAQLENTAFWMPEEPTMNAMKRMSQHMHFGLCHILFGDIQNRWQIEDPNNTGYIRCLEWIYKDVLQIYWAGSPLNTRVELHYVLGLFCTCLADFLETAEHVDVLKAHTVIPYNPETDSWYSVALKSATEFRYAIELGKDHFSALAKEGYEMISLLIKERAEGDETALAQDLERDLEQDLEYVEYEFAGCEKWRDSPEMAKLLKVNENTDMAQFMEVEYQTKSEEQLEAMRDKYGVQVEPLAWLRFLED